jgi:hypothetical protein
MSVVLVIQHAMRMRRITLLPVACLALLYFSTLSHKRHDLTSNVRFDFSLQLLFETFLILRRIQRDIVINVYSSSCKVPVILVTF